MKFEALVLLIERVAGRLIPPAPKVGVVAVTSPLEVTFYGDQSSTAVALKASAYTPAEGDKVLIVKADGQWIVVGKVAAS